jgi:hypothetical protein
MKINNKSACRNMMQFELTLNKLGFNFTKKTLQYFYKYINRFEGHTWKRKQHKS